MYISNSTGGLMLQTMLYLANQSSKALNSLYDFPPAARNDLNEVKCYGVYGCFPLNAPWTSNSRQINTHPQKPSEIHPRFIVYTKKSIDSPMIIDLNEPDGVRNIGINPAGKIYLIAHGYLDSGSRPWMFEMTQPLLSHEDTACVILVDWGGGSSPPYVQAVANIRLVGAITAHIINLLYEELNMANLDNVHMIGHSLGAHLSGYAGYYLQRDFGLKLGRITGMDPAAPLFTDTDEIVRLDSTDAHFVDVIHSDANPLTTGGLGIVKPIGHVDFYPNGGFDNPGCDMQLQEYMKNKENSFLLNMQEFMSCNHVRSYQFFTESITSKCKFMAVTCDSYESFVAGKCANCNKDNHSCIQMGFNSYSSYKHLQSKGKIRRNQPMMAFLMTGDSKPFCRNHYKVSVKISDSKQSMTHGGEIGTLTIKLHSSRKKSTEKMKFSNAPMYFEPGTEYTSVIPGRDLLDPMYASAFWEYQTSLLNPLTWRIMVSPHVYLKDLVIQPIEHGKTLRLCPKEGAPITSGHENLLDVRYCDK